MGPSPRKQTRVHAGDDSTYITFTYKAAQPITDGQLEFIVPVADGWSKPQESDRIDGYTAIEGPVTLSRLSLIMRIP